MTPATASDMTLRQVLTLTTSEFGADLHLRADGRRDAELLLLHILQMDRATLLAHPDRKLTRDELHAYQAVVSRRLNHEPIQYITGRQGFFGLTLKVTSATLIPRPETEHLVEAVLDRVPHDQPLKILDVGTGTGAIALALAAHLPQAEITAIDLSLGALEIAHENAVTNDLAKRIRFVQSDLLAGLASSEREAAFDVIVSNPPYIPEDDRAGLHPQVRDYEPAQALFAGPLGIEIYSRLIPQAHAALKAGGLLAMEIGHGQSDALISLLSDWKDVQFIADLQQVPRVVLARK